MDKIIILDFGGQYAHLIARRIRQLGVYSEILPNDANINKIKQAKGIIFSGGPTSVNSDDAPRPDKEVFNLGIPILGICYGHQLIADSLGGVVKGDIKEYGFATLQPKESKLFHGFHGEQQIWMSHGDTVEKLPEGFEGIGSTEECEAAAFENKEKKIYGLQFHPEVTHTPHGMKILENFVEITKAKKEWDMKNFIENKLNEIKDFVKDKKVFLLVSGGVDSTVCFALLEKALGSERVYGLNVDNGLVRKNEAESIKKKLEEHHFKNFHVVDASEEFLEALKGVYEPEEKRKIIGEMFIKVQESELNKLNLNPEEWIVGQGTIYPDTIETGGTKNADLIKTHHNRVKLVQDLIDQGKIIEPIKELYKDEVRELGEKLGLPKKLVWRHPFPGPGLGVRCLCASKADHIKDEHLVEKKIEGMVVELGLAARILPIKSVGVQGDERTYRHPVVLMEETSWDVLGDLAPKITNKVHEINRVLYLVSEKLEDIEVQDCYITKERLDKLREADDIAMNALRHHGLYDEIWQMPTVLIPVGKNESIVLRPVLSKEAMTAEFARIEMKIVKEIAEEIMKLGFDQVFYDITNKPPGTIEWE